MTQKTPATLAHELLQKAEQEVDDHGTYTSVGEAYARFADRYLQLNQISPELLLEVDN